MSEASPAALAPADLNRAQLLRSNEEISHSNHVVFSNKPNLEESPQRRQRVKVSLGQQKVLPAEATLPQQTEMVEPVRRSQRSLSNSVYRLHHARRAEKAAAVAQNQSAAQLNYRKAMEMHN